MKEIKAEIKWLRGGTVQEVCWISPDTIGWCTGPYIVFYDVNERKLSLPKFEVETSDEGAMCLSAHPIRGVFAYADKNPNPHIHVHTFPSLERLCTCSKQTSYTYLATAFSDDFLITMGSLPDFKFSVWSWRTGEKFASVDSTILDAESFGQSLRINYLPKTYIAQVGNTTGMLCTWEMSVSGDTVLLSRNDLVLPNRAVVKDVAWRPDSSVDILAIADRDGHIYLSNANGTEINLIVLSQRCEACLEIEPAALCWYRGGIILRTTFSQVRFYQKEADGTNWKKLWFKKFENYPCVLTSCAYRYDRVYIFTKQGHIIQMVFHENMDCTLVERYFKGGRFKFLSFVHPWDNNLVVVDQDWTLVVVTVENGARIIGIKLKLDGDITSMMSHPDYPLIIACTDGGEVIFVSIFHYHKPKILGKFLIQLEPLQTLRISKNGRYVIAVDKEQGICYLFNVHFTEPIRAVAQLEVRYKIADLVCFEVGNILKILILKVSASQVMIGHKIYMYDYKKGNKTFKKYPTVFDLGRCYENLFHAPGKGNIFFGSPYLTKQMHFFKIHDWKDVTCVDAVANAHRLRQVKILANRHWICTSSLNGNISARSMNQRNEKKQHLFPVQLLLSTHHRKNCGVIKITINHTGSVVVILGYDGMIVSIPSKELEKRTSEGLPKQKGVKEKTKKGYFHGFGDLMHVDHEKVIAEYARTLDKRLVRFLSQPVQTFGEEENLTWHQWENKQIAEKERLQSMNKKNKILADLNEIKKKVSVMINRNEDVSDLKKLPISVFAMATAFRERLIKSAKDDREEVRHHLELDMHERERVSNWIQTTFWESQKVIYQSVFGIFDNIEVTNYAISKDEFLDPDCVEYSAFARAVTSELFYNETVYPWDTRTSAELNLLFDKQVKLNAKADNTDDSEVREEKDTIFDPEEELNRKLFDGLTAYQFIEQCDYYSQFRYYAHTQIKIDSDNAFSDGEKLRNYFNKKFDEISFQKVREMSNVENRINRINFIISELETMFDETIAEKFEYPKWHSMEQPEKIIDVTRAEVAASMYLSPSELELMKKHAAEEERLRLAKLADDFRDRALLEMMDGVLEFRWDEVIKKDVPKPDCMILKTPDKYTDEDKLAVQRYEQDVKALEQNRETYRKSLHSDFAKYNQILNDNVEKFNERMHEFHLLKMKVESAVQQLDLRRTRYSLRHMSRVKDLREVDDIKHGIKEKYHLVNRISEDIKLLKNVELEMHEYYDNLGVKDKYMERKLRNDFPFLGKVAFGALFKQYKRRPRLVLRTLSPHEVIDLSKAVTSMQKPVFLTPECLEYLKQLTILDIRPAILPMAVDMPHWESLVIFRRYKIAHELRIHASMLEMDQVEQNLSLLSEKLTRERSMIETMKIQLVQTRQVRLDREIDNEIQLVLKFGQVEIANFQGDVNTDTLGTVLVPLRSVLKVNQAILDQGHKKVSAVEHLLRFQKIILVQKWENECLQMKLQHFGTDFHMTQMAPVTRSIQEFLKRRAKGIKEDNSDRRLEKEFEQTRKGQEKLVQGWRIRIKHTNKEIERFLQQNAKLDVKIERMNVDRCEMELHRDYEGEARYKIYHDRVMKLIAVKASLLRKLHASFDELVTLKEEYERVRCSKGMPLDEDECYEEVPFCDCKE